jgi:hypothetical protein
LSSGSPTVGLVRKMSDRADEKVRQFLDDQGPDD